MTMCGCDGSPFTRSDPPFFGLLPTGVAQTLEVVENPLVLRETAPAAEGGGQPFVPCRSAPGAGGYRPGLYLRASQQPLLHSSEHDMVLFIALSTVEARRGTLAAIDTRTETAQ
jgi:hypothetical protein